MRHLALPLSCLAFAAAAAAQATTLIGITQQLPVLMSRDQLACTDTVCTPLGFPPLVGLPYFGGTGWDPRASAAWVSNGPVLALVDDTCGYACAPVPSPTPAPITGLDVVESWNELWATDANSNIVRLTRSCPPAVINLCNTGVIPSPTRGLSGLAVDEGRQLVFYTVSDFATQQTQLRIAPLANPCAPFHIQPVQAGCTGMALRAVTGLACDWGNRILYLTDGMTTVGLGYNFVAAGPSIAFGQVNCCAPAVVDHWIGLAVRPQPAQAFGGPCANGSCPACPMVHNTVGDSNLGNAAFALRLQGAPAGSFAFAAIAFGGCSTAGVTIAGLCGPIWLNPPLLGSLGPNFPAGGGCAATTTFPFALPPNPALANAMLGSQCVALCPGGGTSLSNCLSFVLQGN